VAVEKNSEKKKKGIENILNSSKIKITSLDDVVSID
jgi:hypothetical protein